MSSVSHYRQGDSLIRRSSHRDPGVGAATAASPPDTDRRPAAGDLGSSPSRKPHPIPWLNAAVTEPFYLLHLIVFFSYFTARNAAVAAAEGGADELLHRIRRWEIQAILAFLVLTAVKMVKLETWEAFIADSILYAKGLFLTVLLVIDYRLALCYLLVFIVIYAISQQPPCDALGDVRQLTPLQLESLLTEEMTSRFWLVEFRASFLSASVRTSRILPELSIIYSNKNLSFGIIDLGLFPNASEMFGVYFDQLPSYVLYDKGTEVARYPKVINELNVFKQKVTKKLLCQHFELDNRLIDYIST